MTGANPDRASARKWASRGGVRLRVGATLRTMVASASFAMLVAACAGIKPAPVLPIDPIYEPDTTPQPSDAPLIEPPPNEASGSVNGSSAAAVAEDREGSAVGSGGGGARSAIPGGTAAPEIGAANAQADLGGRSASTSGLATGSTVPAAPATASSVSRSSVAGASATGSVAAGGQVPERVALAPSTLSPTVPGRTGAAAASKDETASGTPQESAEDLQLVKLLADLQRYGSFTGEELKRELTSATAALARQRTDANRIRVGVLYSLVRTSSQDDQHALQLFEAVAKDAPPTSPMRHLATILQAQVLERQRAVKFEQQKGDAAIQKLEALRAMEQSLFRDRVRGGGGGGAGGGGGSGR